MSGEVDIKVNKRSGGSGGSTKSSRGSGSSSFKATPNSSSLKGGKGPSSMRMGTDNITEGAGLVGSHSSSLPSVKGASSSKGNISATNTSNSSLHLQQASNQSPSHSPEKRTSCPREGEAGSSTSLSARLSSKSLSGKRKSPVRTQFNLGPTTSSETGTDQIPQNSIFVPVSASSPSANTSSAVCVTGGGCGGLGSGNNYCAGTSGQGQSPSRSSFLRKERGASASPPAQRTHFAEEEKQAPSSPSKASFYAEANPILSAVKTEPADPNIPWVPGTSAPISVDRVHSVKITRKILHNWRSACGRTKDKTKDLIRRWKTLPENHPDFEKCPNSPSTSKKKGCSTSNLINNSGSPGLGKKKADKGISPPAIKASSKGGGASSAPTSLKVNTPAPASAPSPQTKVEPRVSVTVPPPISASISTPHIPAASSVASPQLRTSSSNKSVAGVGTTTTTKVSFSSPQHQLKQCRTESEMPVVGIGKGLASVSGDGTGSSSFNNPPSSGVGGALGVGRLGSSMSGIGRPSISVTNSSSMVNGRTSGGDSSGRGSGSSSGPSAGQAKSTTGWTVHVWATYVQRDDLEQGLDGEETKKPDREYLSDFQKVKLTHFFRHVLDMNHDDVISAEDFVALNQRIRHYIEWSSECIEFHILKEVHSGFLECFLNQPLDEYSVMYYCSSEKETRHHVNIDEWLDVWGGLLRSARTMESLPLWLQYFPKILFQVINKSGSGTISREELRAFYTMFLGIDFRVVNETLESIHKAMTDGGRHKITYDLFKLCFANFLFGKYQNGPGQYLFGICSPQTLECSFPIDYSALNTHPDDLEPYDPEKDKSQSNRRSVIV